MTSKLTFYQCEITPEKNCVVVSEEKFIFIDVFDDFFFIDITAFFF